MLQARSSFADQTAPNRDAGVAWAERDDVEQAVAVHVGHAEVDGADPDRNREAGELQDGGRRGAVGTTATARCGKECQGRQEI